MAIDLKKLNKETLRLEKKLQGKRWYISFEEETKRLNSLSARQAFVDGLEESGYLDILLEKK